MKDETVPYSKSVSEEGGNGGGNQTRGITYYRPTRIQENEDIVFFNETLREKRKRGSVGAEV